MVALDVPRKETLSDQTPRIILSRPPGVKRNTAFLTVKFRAPGGRVTERWENGLHSAPENGYHPILTACLRVAGVNSHRMRCS